MKVGRSRQGGAGRAGHCEAGCGRAMQDERRPGTTRHCEAWRSRQSAEGSAMQEGEAGMAKRHGEAGTAIHAVRVRQCEAGRCRARQDEAGRLACRLFSILTVKYVSNLHLTCIRLEQF